MSIFCCCHEYGYVDSLLKILMIFGVRIHFDFDSFRFVRQFIDIYENKFDLFGFRTGSAPPNDDRATYGKFYKMKKA